jgi:hypothetical protein
MDWMVCRHLFMLSWIFMVQKRTSIPTIRMVPGIAAWTDVKVNIHLPSQHNTSHGNVDDDRFQVESGSIANINADGTFTHVVVEEEDDDLVTYKRFVFEATSKNHGQK